MASILALEKQISILLEQKKLSTGDQTTAINQQLATLRIQMEASNPIQKTAAAESADCELDSLLTNFSKLRVTAKSHRLRGSNATEDEKKRVEEELNAALDRVTVAKNKKRAHKAGLDAAKDSKLDAFLNRRTTTNTDTDTHDDRKTTGIVHDTTGIMGQHCNPHDKTHPECPGRLLSIMEAIRCTGLYDKCRDIAGRKVTTEELLTVHPMEHIQQVEKLRNKEYRAEQVKKMAQESVYANEHTTEAAYWSCGASMAMTEAVLSGQVQNGLVVARPPGHHAEPCQCMGFCIFNNVAVAAANAVHMGAKKVLIVDWDVHHGNGTQRMFYNNDQIMYVSVHRYDNGSFYPPSKDGGPNMVGGGASGGASGASGGASGGAGGKCEGSNNVETKSGAGPVARLPGVGTNINVAWNSKRLSDSDYLAAFEYCIMPACREFSPDLVYVSAGFDAARGDPLGEYGRASFVVSFGFSFVGFPLWVFFVGFLCGFPLWVSFMVSRFLPDSFSLPFRFLFCFLVSMCSHHQTLYSPFARRL
jgi:acetoin utilization deacetylase AcuC-like enzyme